MTGQSERSVSGPSSAVSSSVVNNYSAFVQSNLIAFSGDNCGSEALICIPGADGCFTPSWIGYCSIWRPPSVRIGADGAALHGLLTAVNGLKVTLSLITESV